MEVRRGLSVQGIIWLAVLAVSIPVSATFSDSMAIALLFGLAGLLFCLTIFAIVETVTSDAQANEKTAWVVGFFLLGGLPLIPWLFWGPRPDLDRRSKQYIVAEKSQNKDEQQ